MATITELTMENIVRKAMEYRIGSSSVSMDLELDSSLASLDDMISEKVRLPSNGGGGGSADLTCMPADTMGGGSVIIGECGGPMAKGVDCGWLSDEYSLGVIVEYILDVIGLGKKGLDGGRG